MRKEIHKKYQTDSSICEFVDGLPQRFEQEGTLLYDERNVIRRFEVNGTVLVVKRFKRPNFFQRIAYTFFRSSKAFRAYHNGEELIRRGISTPFPIAYLETYSTGLIEYAYYVCGEDNAPPIADLFNRVEEFDRPLAKAFAHFAAHLHQLGILHHDLNSTNTLFHPIPSSPDTYTFSVIDINRMDFMEGLPPLKECLENLTRFTGRMDLFTYVAKCYSEVMADSFGLQENELLRLAVRQKENHDARWKRRKNFLKRFK